MRCISKCLQLYKTDLKNNCCGYVSGKVIRDKLKLTLRFHVNELKAEILLKENPNDQAFEFPNINVTVLSDF